RVARDNQRARIVVTGCYATRRPDEVAELANVARVVTNDEKASVIRLALAGACLPRTDLAQSEPEGGPVAASTVTTAERFGDGDGSCGAGIAPGIAGRTAFTLRVQTGCAEPCAYCIIPTTRGRPRSLGIEAVQAEIDRVISAGFKEIALTGVHLGSYGRDLIPPVRLIDLLGGLDDRHGTRRPAGRSNPPALFRISSLEPMDCVPEIVDLVASSDCFAPHF